MIDPSLPLGAINSIYDSSGLVPNKNTSGQTVSETLQRAKALLYQSARKQIDPRAINLVFMAKTALKNGNPLAAENFASKAMRILNPRYEIKYRMNDYPEENIPLAIDNKKLELPEKEAQVKHTYKDVSNDPGVSFTYESSLSGPQSFFAVPAHEAEHVGRRVSEAVLNGERIWVIVSYRIRYDPETGQPYLAGGTTRTIKFTHAARDDAYPGIKLDIKI